MSGAAPGRFITDLAVLAKLRLSGVPAPPVASARGERSLFIGPANSAGQGAAWARAAERSVPGLEATSMAFAAGDRFAFPVDASVRSGYAAHSRAWQKRQAAALSRFDAALLESGRAVLSRWRGGDPLVQLRWLQDEGVRVALLFHGSDIRDPDAHIAAEPHSHFAADPDFAETFRPITAQNRRLIAEAGVPVFVSTPDLLDEVPNARWLPVAIDASQWAAERPPLDGRGPDGSGPLRIVHIPSSSLIKGTELIDPVLQSLAAAGTIDYRTVTGIPHSEMPDAYRAADVVVDQFRVGNYGVAACEGLAAGRIVVSHVSARVRERTRELTGEDLPVVEATAETLSSVLERIAADPETYRAIAARGPAFVRAHHDGRASGAVLRDWMAEGPESRTMEGTPR